MNELMTTPLENVKARLEKNANVLLEKVAEESQITVEQVIQCLPQSMWQRIDGQLFTQVLAEVSAWGDVTVIVHSKDVVMEFCGSFPQGNTAHNFYNLHGKNGLSGHLRYKNCQAIYVVEKPFMGKKTASLLFTNAAGEVMFKIYLTRDEAGEIKHEQLVALRALPEKLKAITQ